MFWPLVSFLLAEGQFRYLRQQGAQLNALNNDPESGREVRSSPADEDFVLLPSAAASATPDYNDYLRVLTKRRMSKISCLKSCVGQHILHPM